MIDAFDEEEPTGVHELHALQNQKELERVFADTEPAPAPSSWPPSTLLELEREEDPQPPK